MTSWLLSLQDPEHLCLITVVALLVRWIPPPANCYNATAAGRPVVSGLPAQQSLDRPLFNATQAPFNSVCLDTGSCSPPGAAGSALVRKKVLWQSKGMMSQSWSPLAEIMLSNSAASPPELPAGLHVEDPSHRWLTNAPWQGENAKSWKLVTLSASS